MPAASTCKNCHPRQYEQWSKSQHSYAQLSPVYHAMQARIQKLTNGTNSDFCIRCHNPVGMNLGEDIVMDNTQRHPTSREGITCITCHRMKQPLGKVVGRLPLEQGDMTQPVYGPNGNKVLSETLKVDGLKVTSKPGERGRKIHGKVEEFKFLETSGFCAVCHEVTLVNGFRLEEAFSEYKQSPAAKRGESCQDCHMGKIPGKKSGYAQGPAAIVNGHKTPDRKLTDHRFVGPDYSIVHPGIFPHNPEAAELADINEWILFDHKAGWGTDDFEDNVSDDAEFPERWEDLDDRIEARELLNEQLEKLDGMAEARKALLKHAYRLGDIEVISSDNTLSFRTKVMNGTDGHNVPTGFIGERLVWMHIQVKDAQGNVVFQSGDLDPNGDLRDTHSAYVHNGEIPLDTQLFNLQSVFLTRNIRGGERAQVLPINTSVDPLPFLRPDAAPTSLKGRIQGARIHRQGIESNGYRWANYSLPEKLPEGEYTITAQLKAGMVPVNLVIAVQEAGFDYNMSPKDVAESIVAGHQVLWQKQTSIQIKREKQ